MRDDGRPELRTSRSYSPASAGGCGPPADVAWPLDAPRSGARTTRFRPPLFAAYIAWSARSISGSRWSPVSQVATPNDAVTGNASPGLGADLQRREGQAHALGRDPRVLERGAGEPDDELLATPPPHEVAVA